MYYTIKSRGIPVNIPDELLKVMESECPECLSYDKVDKKLSVVYTGEGFNLEEIEAYLSCATVKGKLHVHMEDHKGETSFAIHYGPGFCYED